MIDEIKITSLSGRGSVVMRTKDHNGYWLGPVDWGQAEGRHQTYSYYNQVGESIVSTTIATRPLTITGWVIATEEVTLQSRCDFLNAFISPMEDYCLEYRNRKINFRPDSSIVYTRERRSDNEIVRKFMIQAICPYPLFKDLNDTSIPFDATRNRFVFPTNWGQTNPLVFAIQEKIYNVAINNTGGIATGIVALLKFSGDVQNPRIKNLTTDKFIGVTSVFHNGERLEMSTSPGNKYIKRILEDGTEENLIKYRDYQMNWIMLEPGENILAIDCDNLDQRANMTVTVKYTPLYLEVE